MNRKNAINRLVELKLNHGYDSDTILEEILVNYLSGAEACNAIEHCFESFGIEEEDDIEELG
jgi:hypothetical protein